jgi:hypothetical protein
MRAETDTGALAFPSAGRAVLPRAAVIRVAAQLLPFVLALSVYVGALVVMHPSATGDEPHYLVIAGSLVHDRDVDLANDYASRGRVLDAYESFPLEPHAATFGSSPALRSVHGHGLPALLAPALALGGVTLARLFLVLLAALLADQLFRLLRDLGGRLLWRSLAWAAVVLCLPLVAFSSQIYPEIPAALAVVAILRIAIRPSPPAVALLGGSLAAALLPWLHVRFIPAALAATLALAYAAYRTPERSRIRDVARALVRLPGRALLVCAPPVVSLAAMALAFERWYGSPRPDAAYSAFYGGDVGGGGLGFLYHYLLSDLFHAGDGWIPYSPVAWLGLAGVGLVVWRWRAAGAAALGAVALYAGLVASTGLPVGYQFPGRILLAATVLVAVPLALALEHVPVARALFVPLLALSLAIAVAAARDHESLYASSGNRDDARIALVRGYRNAFPDTRPRAPVGRVVVEPGAFAPMTGRVEGGRAVASEARGDPGGVLLYGPHGSLAAGSWTAVAPLRASGTPGRWHVARLEVWSAGRRLLRRPVAAREIAGPGPTEIAVSFVLPERMPVDVWVRFRGHGTLATGAVVLTPEEAIERSAPRLPDWPLALLWAGGTALAGAVFVGTAAARARRRK